MLSLAAAHSLEVGYFDFNMTLINANIDRPLYMTIPEGLEVDKSKYACKLLNEFYGLVQFTYLWYFHLREFLETIGFKTTLADSSVYVHPNGILLLVYADDELVIADNQEKIESFIRSIENSFSIKLTKGDKFVGMEITRSSRRF